jgi:hypothetical protein
MGGAPAAVANIPATFGAASVATFAISRAITSHGDSGWPMAFLPTLLSYAPMRCLYFLGYLTVKRQAIR